MHKQEIQLDAPTNIKQDNHVAKAAFLSVFTASNVLEASRVSEEANNRTPG